MALPSGWCFVCLALPVDLFFIMRSQKAYRRLFKERLVRSELEKQFGDLRYLPEAGIPASSIEQTGMMRMGNRYHAEDYLSGTAGGVPFEQSDVCIQNVTSNGKSTSTVTYFRGRWLIFSFNKRFTHNMLVVSDSFSYAKRPGGFFGKDRSERLSMESEAFNDAFKVYAQDAHEAYYILTPPLMERLLALERAAGLRAVVRLLRQSAARGRSERRRCVRAVAAFAAEARGCAGKNPAGKPSLVRVTRNACA